jgi:hypothetical protein
MGTGKAISKKMSFLCLLQELKVHRAGSRRAVEESQNKLELKSLRWNPGAQTEICVNSVCDLEGIVS